MAVHNRQHTHRLPFIFSYSSTFFKLSAISTRRIFLPDRASARIYTTSTNTNAARIVSALTGRLMCIPEDCAEAHIKNGIPTVRITIRLVGVESVFILSAQHRVRSFIFQQIRIGIAIFPPSSTR